MKSAVAGAGKEVKGAQCEYYRAEPREVASVASRGKSKVQPEHSHHFGTPHTCRFRDLHLMVNPRPKGLQSIFGVSITAVEYQERPVACLTGSLWIDCYTLPLYWCLRLPTLPIRLPCPSSPRERAWLSDLPCSEFPLPWNT